MISESHEPVAQRAPGVQTEGVLGHLLQVGSTKPAPSSVSIGFVGCFFLFFHCDIYKKNIVSLTNNLRLASY